MLTAEHWPSLLKPGRWAWYVTDTDTGETTRGTSADEWLAKAHIRVTIRRYEEQDERP